MRYYLETEIDFSTEFINYEQFLLQEFFNSKPETWAKITAHYRNVYGDRSLSYLTRKFHEWKNGDYHLTNLMESRIIETMQKFLTNEAKEKLCLNDFLSLIKRSIKHFEKKYTSNKYNPHNFYSTEAVMNLFQKELKDINEIDLQDVRFGLLTTAEIDEAKEVVKYILKTKLQNCFNQFIKDLSLVLPFVNMTTKGKVSIIYHLRMMNIAIDLKKVKLATIQFPKFEIRDIKSKTKFDSIVSKYLAFEIMDIHQKNIKSTSDGLINEIDIKILSEQYEKFTLGENEVEINSNLRGEAGDLIIKITVTPVKLLRIAITKSVYRILIVLIILIMTISWLVNYKYFVILFVFWQFLLIAALAIAYFLWEEIKSIINNTNEIKNYG